MRLAGALTHADMQELFKPVPFGEQPHITPLERAVLLPFWESFRSIEMDKQKRVLEVGHEAPRLLSQANK